ncbi:MAG TPA: hypothetical protein VGB59_12575 [Allosphingosinicella sp.]|jgi:hypothetical protein
MKRLTIGVLAAAIAAAAAAAPAAAQQPAAPAAAPAKPSPFLVVTEGRMAAKPADVASLDAILRAVYDVISGPAGQRRDWNRMRSLFTANARMMPHGPRGLRSGSVEDYIVESGPFLEGKGFIEREIGRTVEQYGDIAQVFSAYEARHVEGGPVIMRGINSIQLVRHQDRWWVVSILWQPETPATPITKKYLFKRPAGKRG